MSRTVEAMVFGLRQDQLDRFVLIKRPEVTVVWGYAPTTGLFHATVNGLRPCCRSTTVLDETAVPLSADYDRSSDLMTCERCLGMVRRIRTNLTEVRKDALERASKRIRLAALPPVEPRCSSGKVYRT